MRYWKSTGYSTELRMVMIVSTPLINLPIKVPSEQLLSSHELSCLSPAIENGRFYFSELVSTANFSALSFSATSLSDSVFSATVFDSASA
jgi:hypothetical protein